MNAVFQVALPLPLPNHFDYLPPLGWQGPAPALGARVRVPFGPRQLVGVVCGHEPASGASNKLRRVNAVLDRQGLFSDELWQSLLWAARYWQHPLGEVLAAAIPAMVRDEGQAAGARSDFALCAVPDVAARTRLRVGSAPAQLLQMLEGGAKTWSALRAALPNAATALRRLEQLMLVERIALDASARQALIHAPPLNADQHAAVAAVRAALDGFAALLLEGVTGSGKTEVYLGAIEPVLKQGLQTLVLVPEIGLTPQLLTRFRERLAAPVLALHSALSDGERARVWQRVRSGESLVLVGTRSAVFAPFAKLALIVIDEEHDASLKQHEGFRYHARDLALVRAKRLGIPVLMGSATPALETLLNARSGRFQHLHLPERAGFAAPPSVELIDLRRQRLREGLTQVATNAIGEHLARGEQVLVFRNRRGFAPVLQCRDCGWHAECDRCDRPFTFHRKRNRLVCHPCGRERPAPVHCPVCGEATSPLGIGTERLEEVLVQRFPQVPVLRVDRDSTRTVGSFERLLAQAQSGTPCVLVGTQMLAKGHDLPNITLAVIVDADQGLYSMDFRASERMAQLIIQVAGRSGRGHKAGRVLIQTHHPEHPTFTHLLAGGYRRFAEHELELRQSLSFPPFAAMALLRAEALEETPLTAFFETARTHLIAAKSVHCIGPMPASQPRRAGVQRMQLILQCNDRSTLHNALNAFVPALYTWPESKRVRWSLDVDPLSLD
jgi:primosomal protein N' (replication factor Y) (superfamily II helicase)